MAWAGLGLARQVEGCDAELVLLFALLHDSQRFNDSRDPEHGLRAALFARELQAEGVLALDDERLAVLVDACTRHDKGYVSDDPTTGACWDADRLNLWRVGITPEARLLSTWPAREPELIDEARSFHGLSYIPGAISSMASYGSRPESVWIADRTDRRSPDGESARTSD